MVHRLQCDKVVAPQCGETYQNFLYLHGEDVHSFNDKHIIAPSLDAVDAQMRTPTRTFAGENTSQVAGAISDKRHHFAIERSQYQFPYFSFGNGVSGFGIDNFHQITVFPEMHSVLLLTFEGYTRSVHLCHSEAIVCFQDRKSVV